MGHLYKLELLNSIITYLMSGCPKPKGRSNCLSGTLCYLSQVSHPCLYDKRKVPRHHDHVPLLRYQRPVSVSLSHTDPSGSLPRRVPTLSPTSHSVSFRRVLCSPNGQWRSLPGTVGRTLRSLTVRVWDKHVEGLLDLLRVHPSHSYFPCPVHTPTCSDLVK